MQSGQKELILDQDRNQPNVWRSQPKWIVWAPKNTGIVNGVILGAILGGASIKVTKNQVQRVCRPQRERLKYR